MQLHVVVVDVFEAATRFRYPVVRHAFYGRSREEADGYFRAHLETDSFLRDCLENKRWNGVSCETEVFHDTVKHA